MELTSMTLQGKPLKTKTLKNGSLVLIKSSDLQEEIKDGGEEKCLNGNDQLEVNVCLVMSRDLIL